MTDKEMEAVPPKGSLSEDGVTGLAYAQGTPGDDSHICSRSSEADPRAVEIGAVDPHAHAGTSSSGKSKVIRAVTTNRMHKGRERTAIQLVCSQVCVEARSGHQYRWAAGGRLYVSRPWEASRMCLGHGRPAVCGQAMGGQLYVARPWEASCMWPGHGRPAVCV